MSCYVGIEILPRERTTAEFFWQSVGARIDRKLLIYTRSSKAYQEELTFEKAVEMFVENRKKIELNSFILVLKVRELVSAMQRHDYSQNDQFVEMQVCVICLLFCIRNPFSR